jgi:hypothetical protein
MSSATAERFRGLDAEAFAELVAQTWREYGWEVVRPAPEELPTGTGDVTEPLDSAVALLVRSAEPRVIVAAPGEEGVITAPTLLRVYAEAAEPQHLLVVSAVGFDTGALSIADAYGIDTVGPEALTPLAESVPSGAVER